MTFRPAAIAALCVLARIASGQTTQPAPTDPPDSRPDPPRISATEIDGPQISGQGGIVPVRVLDGRVIVSCDLSGPRRRIPVNLSLDFDGAYGLQLHNRAAAPLPAETADGQALALTLHFPDFTLTVPRRELGDEEEFEAFTKYHSSEMGENALVGAIGAHYLKAFDVVLDLAMNRIELRPPGGLAGRSPGVTDDEAIVPISEHNDLVWLPVTIPGGRELAMAIATSSFDTRIDRAICDALARPAGDIGPVTCGGHDLGGFVAFRPEDVIQVHPSGVAGTTGVNLLQSFRIAVDRLSGLASLRVTDETERPESDLEFFRAMVAEDAALVAAWLDATENHRLGREAAELLLTLHLEEAAEAETLRAALQKINDTMVEDLRATRMLDLMEELSNEGETDLVIAAGEIGVESGRKDRYPDAVHKIHGRLGEVLLERGDDREAWRHLLSAAFGLPEDGLINLNLGRYYERTGRFRRAFSRYIQAVIREESGPQAMEGLLRIDGRMEGVERLSLDVIERMIAGKVRSDTAPVKFAPSDETPVTNRTVLVEFFTNAYLGDERRGAIGGALGNQRLLTHFEPKHCVFLSYHLADPQPDPLVNALAASTAELLGAEGPVVQMINGVIRAPGAARWRDAERVYNAARDEVIFELARPSDYAIDLEATLRDGRLAGYVAVSGPDAGPGPEPGPEPESHIRVQVVVAERGVLFPGKSTVVIHRHLARGALLGDAAGVSVSPGEGLLFDRALADIERENLAYLDELETAGAGTVTRMSTTIDPRSVVLVAIVRRGDSGEVLQARQITPELIEDDRGAAP